MNDIAINSYSTVYADIVSIPVKVWDFLSEIAKSDPNPRYPNFLIPVLSL